MWVLGHFGDEFCAGDEVARHLVQVSGGLSLDLPGFTHRLLLKQKGG